MRGLRPLVTTLIALALAPAAAACTHPRASLTALEGEVMCPICHTTLDQSDSAVAKRIEAFIGARIARCESSAQIKQELVDQFGPAILAAPQHTGFDLLAWWLPLGGVIAGAIVIPIGIWRWARSREPAGADGAGLDPALDRRVDEELARFDG